MCCMFDVLSIGELILSKLVEGKGEADGMQLLQHFGPHQLRCVAFFGMECGARQECTMALKTPSDA